MAMPTKLTSTKVLIAQVLQLLAVTKDLRIRGDLHQRLARLVDELV